MKEKLLLGDEAVAVAAVHAGITAAYSYPGTPATEIMECLRALSSSDDGRSFGAFWCANEKTAYEEAAGVSFAGGRSLVSMKHVGLNVAADPFINSALVDLRGGLVLAVADDPGMHSSQNEQDSRFYADFARTICLEPSSAQEAYDMTREAFLLSERWQIPVLVRLVTRLAHGRSAVRLAECETRKPVRKGEQVDGWILIPSNARRQWRKLLDLQPRLLEWSEGCPYNLISPDPGQAGWGVITSGIARNHFEESRKELPDPPAHLHIGAYPLPMEKIREFARNRKSLLILEEGYPFIERSLRGLLPQAVAIEGKLSGRLREDGELTPDAVRQALLLPPRPVKHFLAGPLPPRPPQLCSGCPHADIFHAIQIARKTYPETAITSDIGCYTLGALPPYSAIESCLCMGASVSMAKGAADAGLHPVVAVIGDSTFLHSGITPLIDAVAANANMTLIILDNAAVAMTGGQPQLLPSSRLEKIVLGLGVEPEHLKIITALPRETQKNSETLLAEMNYRGLSVLIAVRECVETAKKKKTKV